MPEFVHTFQNGKMNKDLDERLVPNGQYRDALNLDLANSEGSNVGTLQNVKGNVELRGKANDLNGWQANYIEDLSNPVCIGSIKNDIDEKIYWFIASDSVSAIAELDTTTGYIHPILVDKNNILKFDEDYLITGINIIDKFIFWTDDQTEPKRININKFKAGSCDFNTHTKIPDYVPNDDVYVTVNCGSLSSYDDFTEEDIVVIKKSPLTAPSLVLAATPFGTNPDGSQISGVGISPVNTQGDQPIPGETTGFENFTYIPNVANFPEIYESLPTYGEYQQNIADEPLYYQDSNLPSNWNGNIVFNVSPIYGNNPTNGQPVWKPFDFLVLSGTFEDDNETFEYSLRVLIISLNNTEVTAQIQGISANILKVPGTSGAAQLVQWEVLLEEEQPMFEFVFPRFAYRWKYIDNEYSTFSPFSSVAFVGSEFKYLSSDGHNIGMTNNIRKLIIESLELGTEEVDEIEILYKESHNTAVYSVDSIKKKDFAPYNSSAGPTPTSFEIKSEIIGSVIQPNQLLRPWDNVPLYAKSQEIVGNRIVYGNYVQNYTVDPTLEIDVNIQPLIHQGSLGPTAEAVALIDPADNDFTRMPFLSLKTIRTYQVGVVFKDEYGRETPVFTNKSASIINDIRNSDARNRLIVRPNSNPPSWATHFKYFVKETSNEYYNLALDRFYPAEDGNVWLSFPSSERNKVDEETYLILKKQHDNNIALDNITKYKILAIDNEAPDYVKTFDQVTGSARVTIVSGFIEDSLALQFSLQNTDIAFAQTLRSQNELEIVYGGTTDRYVIISRQGSDTGTEFVVGLEEPLGTDAEFLPAIGTDVTINVYALEEENKPEFEGRFFAKINRDFAFDTNIIASFKDLEPRYGIIANYNLRTKASTNTCSGTDSVHDERLGGHFLDPGEDPSWLSECQDEYRCLQNGVVGSRFSQEFRQLFDAPKTGNDKIGAAFVGTNTINGGAWNGRSGRLFNQTINAGSLVRIRHNDGRVTKPYRVLEIEFKGKARGAGRYPVFPCNNQLENIGNEHFCFAARLAENIVESWVGNGSDGALDNLKGYELVREVISDNNKLLTSNNPAIFETEPKEAVDLDLYYEATNAFPISEYNNQKTLDYTNCFSFGNGVESNRIRDDFNANTIDKGPKVSAPLDEPYAAERRGNGLIFSQIFNSTSGVNRLNQFIQAEPITKDLNPTYGTIQKLHTRQTDLLAMCEDKIVKILANKDALFNADGNVNLTGNTAVLGQAMVPATFGEYGISKNPESFAIDNYRVYFADKNRGAVLRLSMNGIVNIADKGMTDFFADNLKASNKIIGSFDQEKDLYNITLDGLSQQWVNAFSPSQDYQLNPDCNTNALGPVNTTTVSFKEMVDGWTSRKSFIPESGVSLNNVYYTFKLGRIYEHGLNVAANNFYRVQYDSSFNVLINDAPNSVKGFSTLNYSGTRSRRFEYQVGQKFYSIAEINALQAIPTAVQEKNPGWYVNFIKTNLEGGEVKEFEKKEGKYFNFIKGLEIFNDCDFIGDGIGNPDVIESDPQNYILKFTIDETCSDSGGTDIDATQFFFYQWWLTKQDPSTQRVILNETSAQDAKCVIEDFYAQNAVSSNYSNVQNFGSSLSYRSSDGLAAGTQMYLVGTTTPATAGTYLFTTTGQTQSDVSISHAGLDAGNATSVPSSYYIMILASDGKISSYTQYNTLTSCTNIGPPNGFKSVFARYISQERPVSTPIVNIITPYFTLATDTNEEIICKHKTALAEYNASPLPPTETSPGAPPYKNIALQGYIWRWYDSSQGGTDTIQLGTIIRDSNGNPLTFATAGIYSNAAPVFPTIQSWADITNFDDFWYIVRTNTSGEVIEFQRINELSNPTCT